MNIELVMSSNSAGPPLRSHPSSELDYFDIDDIIATQGRIPSKLEAQIYNLGFLDPSSEGNDLQAGAKLELPLWLAKELCNRRRKIVTVDIPKAYKDSYREIFKADASVVDLHRLGPYFFEFGTKLLHFDFQENSQMASSMQEVCWRKNRGRGGYIIFVRGLLRLEVPQVNFLSTHPVSGCCFPQGSKLC